MKALISRLTTSPNQNALPYRGVLVVFSLVLGMSYLVFEANRLELDVNYVSVSGDLNPAQRRFGFDYAWTWNESNY